MIASSDSSLVGKAAAEENIQAFMFGAVQTMTGSAGEVQPGVTLVAGQPDLALDSIRPFPGRVWALPYARR